MRPSKIVFRALLFSLPLAVWAFLLPVRAVAQSDGKVLYAFNAPLPSCFGPGAPLIADARGNLYGTTSGGGADGQGCVFELSPVKGRWVESVLWSFTGPDGNNPEAALIFDRAGNLYGTGGGGAYDAGVVFELSPSSDGWSETVLHSFGNGDDGWGQQSNLIFDDAGNLYGTTGNSGGQIRGGTVFKLSPGASGWTETILYTFPASIAGPDGDGPVGGVVMDAKGRLYGVTEFGGATGSGAVYELAPERKKQVCGLSLGSGSVDPLLYRSIYLFKPGPSSPDCLFTGRRPAASPVQH